MFLAGVTIILLAMLGAGCSGGSSNEGTTAEIYIQSPPGGTVTSANSITVSGNASMTNAANYPTGDVYWFNTASGASGAAVSNVVCIIGCLRAWQAQVPLAIGTNVITVTFNDASASLTVIRSAGVSGYITTDGVIGVARIAVKAEPTSYGGVTDSSGFYTINGLVAGNYTITPQSPAPTNGGACLSFTPASRSVSLDGTAILTGQDFIAAPLNSCYSISGHIAPSTDPTGAYANVHVITKDAFGNPGPYAYTDALGNYKLYPFAPGTYTVIPDDCVFTKCATFTPPSQSVMLVGNDVTGINFLLSW